MMTPSQRRARASLRVVAVFEAAKGLLVLIAAAAAMKFLHRDAEAAVEHLVYHLHLDPAGRLPRVFLHAASQLTETRLMLVATGAIAYAALRFAEAYGLWRERRWGWVLGIVSAGLYVPIEMTEIIRHFTWPRVAVLALNVLIIAVLWFNRAGHGAPAR